MSAGEANQPTLSWAQDESNPATEDWAQQSVLAFLLLAKTWNDIVADVRLFQCFDHLQSPRVPSADGSKRLSLK